VWCPQRACVLYKIEHAYSIFDMNVTGEVVRAVSSTYSTTTGKHAESDSVMICPDADQVNISICTRTQAMSRRGADRRRVRAAPCVVQRLTGGL
jgi:hypothetical protein